MTFAEFTGFVAVIGFGSAMVFSYMTYLKSRGKTGVWLNITLGFAMLTVSSLLSVLVLRNASIGYLEQIGAAIELAAVAIFFASFVFYSNWSRFLE